LFGCVCQPTINEYDDDDDDDNTLTLPCERVKPRVHDITDK